ncbi:methylated-DNA--[protein]-cysteine S-methyltransferase [Pilimelia columellifera]|uniref:Methylated-DNA--protein-cysteine methyltransferase n=1 Tax=Pilimelia columellifera subsp. columellifera TaxID=706583 RepID=A0ABN3MV75_9ACTN
MDHNVGADVLGAFPVTGGELDRLRERLVRAAQDEGLLDVAYRVVDSPLGPLLLAATARGLVRVGLPAQGHDAVLADLAATVSPRVLAAPARLDPVARQLDEYFARGRRDFDVPLDLPVGPRFRAAVLARLAAIPFGGTATYSQVAAEVGSPLAVRAVGSACAANPVPLVLPCHRVVRADGGCGGYAGGVVAKRWLIDLERGAA